MKPDNILYGKKEFTKNLNNKKYEVYKIDNNKKELHMINIFKTFLLNLKKNINEKHYIGIDFEFNKVSKQNRDVALMQLNLENNLNIGYIFLLHPPKLNEYSYNILIKLITNPHIIKILHGSESLDIPYLFNQLLITKKNIDGFCKNFYDTKFLCDYINIFNSNQKISCSIYDVLLNNNIITKKQINKLDNIEEKMGPIYLIYIDIYKLDNNLLKYALYDVLYLPQLIKKYFTFNDLYYLLISEVSTIINKNKRNIDNNFNELELLVNKMNNYFFYDKKNRYSLYDIWTFYYISMTSNKHINILKEINYFKQFIKIITKFIIYNNITKKYTIYQNKNETFNNNINDYIIWIKKYPYINNLIEHINIFIYDDINNWII